MKVSVIVPAYNPGGEALEQLIGSLVGQSLAVQDYEIIVVDDASTDGSGDTLDRLATEHEQLRVIHNAPNSGWPGKPRNLGIDAAGGEFLYFVDADDWLAPEALERMYAYAIANDSDIVWGKVVGHNRAVPHTIFDANIPDAKLGTHRLLSLLTVHKMFRTSVIRDHGIRFPEGRVRLEDHMFVMAAYFAARKISVLADYTCYHWIRLEDGSHISSEYDDPADYFGSVRRVLDVVDANTEPGPLRDRLTAHWWGGKSLARFEGQRLDGLTDRQVLDRFDTVRRLALDRFPASLDTHLAAWRRVEADLVRSGDLDGLRRYCTWTAGIALDARVTELWWRGSELHLSFECVLVDAGGAPLTARQDGEVTRLTLPPSLGLTLSADADLAVPRLVASTSVSAYLRARTGGITEKIPVRMLARPEFDASGTAQLRARAEAVIDCAGSAVARTAVPLTDLFVRCSSGGWLAQARAAAPDQDRLDAAGVATLDGSRFKPYGTSPAGNLSLRRSAEEPEVSAAPRGANGIIATMTSAADRLKRQGGRATLARRAGTVAAKLGLPITDLFPGVSVISRRDRKVVATPLAEDVSVVAAGKHSGKVTTRSLAEDISVVAAGKLSANAIGKRSWLLSRPDPSPRAELDLETQVLKHFVDRHVAWILDQYQVDLVIDVGANTGQYATALRKRGYRGHIASFEPVPAFAEALQKKAAKDDRWSVHAIALGSEEGSVPMTVQRTFSSLLKSSDYGKDRFTTLREFSDAEPVDVPVRRLDAILDDLLEPVRVATGRSAPRVYLKMDTQGFDLQAFRGLGERAGEVVALQSEVALLLIYEGMPRMPEAVATYEGAGFEISGLYPVTREKDGRIIEYDCVMVRASALPA